jgi:hypothetical protein
MAYTENKKIGGLTGVTGGIINDNDNVVVEQGGTAKKATLLQLIAKIFNISSVLGPNDTVTSDSAVVVRQNGSVAKVGLTSLTPSESITNTQISSTANIADTKLATISTAGKVANSATTASTGNVNSPATIVARDSSGNFTANIVSAALAGTANSANNITGGSAGSILYQSSAGVTAKLTSDAGTNTKFLMSNGVNPPSWETFTSSTATATNLAGGSIGAIPFQSSANNTAFVSPGAVGAVLTSNGAGAPVYISSGSASGNATFVRRDTNGSFAGATITATAFQGGSVAGTTGSFNGALTATTGTFSGALQTTGLTVTGAGTITTGTGGISASGLITANAGITVPSGQNLNGNASTATKLNSTRTFALTGPVTGTVNSDLTSGATIPTAITDGSVGPEKLNNIYAARAWVTFAGNGTVLAGSPGVSITRNSVGNYTVNIPNGVLSGSNYAVFATLEHVASANSARNVNVNSSNTKTATQVSLIAGSYNWSTGAQQGADFDRINVVIFQ